HLELAIIGRVAGDFAAATVGEPGAVVQADVAEAVGGEVLAGMAVRALALADEQQAAAARRLADGAVVAARVAVVGRIAGLEGLLVRSQGPAKAARGGRTAVGGLERGAVGRVGVEPRQRLLQ